jgi:hypothetical protein
MSMIVMTPTRNRARKIRQLMDVWPRTVTRPDTTLELYVDDDDEQLPDYRVIVDEFSDLGVSMFVSPRQQLGPMLNRYALQVAERCDVIGNIGDDHRPRTVGWDEKLHDAVMANDPAIVYGDDLYQGKNLPTAVFMSPSVVRTLGYMVPPGMIHLYLDDFWRDLGNAAGILHYRPDIVIEHMHPGINKAGWDHIYIESNTKELYAHDECLFKAYLEEGMAGDVAKLSALIAARQVVQ